ncbi:hypothetical protein M514_20445 [Trichuris suis]|uniref:Uncharacterized protein n=1 Tax=Trichuris suis TaxID=68888 RepID=A0A085ND63_9BILA|nr:hypothetical protein M514_20445 [Trichuris suis]
MTVCSLTDATPSVLIRRFKRETLEKEVAIDCQHAIFFVTHSWKRLNDHPTTTTQNKTEHGARN